MTQGVPAHLRDRYAMSLAAKREAFVAAWTAFAAAPDDANARALHLLAHRLAGSAPAYGYEVLGALARDVDAHLTGWLEIEPDARAEGEQIVARVAPLASAVIERLAAQG